MVDLSLLQDFIAETVEYLEEMEDSFLRLEADLGNRIILDDIFRSVHTIKGAAEYLGIERIAELSRTIENMLYQQRHSELQVDQEAIALLREGRERIFQLTDNLKQTQTEDIEIDDLVERIRVADTTSQISAVAGRAAAGAQSEAFAAGAAGDSLPLGENAAADDEYEDDEYDEELFAIFLEQMGDKLSEIRNRIVDLAKADRETRIAALDFCLAGIEPLTSSANYMGYSRLTDFYGKWGKEICSTRENLSIIEDDDRFSTFISDCMEANIAALVSRYPQLQITASAAISPPAEPEEIPVTPEPQVQELPVADSVTTDNFTEHDANLENAGDILEEYAENSDPASVSSPGVGADNERETNLFERLSWSFDSRIKQTAVKLPEENLNEIEAELFSTAGSAAAAVEAGSAASENSVTTGNDNVPPGADGSVLTDNYEEENDAELFSIFQEQLQEEVSRLQIHTSALAAAGSKRTEILESCIEKLRRLGSAANYMGYEQLVIFYEMWTKAVALARDRVLKGDDSFIPAFVADCMQANITTLSRRFPQHKSSEPESFTSVAVSALGPAMPKPAAAAPDLPSSAGVAVGEIVTASRPATISDISLLPDFIAETREHLQEMEKNLLLLVGDSGRRESLDDIFRSVHTIKGAAEYLGIDRIAKLSHNLENLLYQLRQQQLIITPEITALLMAGWDRISLLTEDLEQTRAESAEIGDLIERIAEVDGSSKTASGVKSSAAACSSEPESADVQEIEKIAAALKTENEALLQGTDRRQPDQSMRRQSDQINEKIVKQSIRVDAGKIDALMNQVGELVVSRAGFSQLLSGMQQLHYDLKQRFKLDTRDLRQLTGMTSRLSEATTLFDKVTNELQEEVMKIRMLPISQLFNRYPRLVFDLVRDTGKKVELDIHGEETELDKMVIEEISDPLIHIIRNAVDHGIETPAVRLEKGKPETGTIRLKAYHEGNHVVIEIMDDGRGLDLERLKEKALAGNFISANELARMSNQEITELIMMPGFSTAAAVTHISGRGVGMDVVRKNIEKLNGTIEIESTPEVALRFRIKIPLTLAIIPALRIKVGAELFTIPLSTVEETLRIFPDQISTIEGVEVISFRGSTLPLVHMAELFNLEGAGRERFPAYVVVVSTGMKRIGLVVDALLRQEEVVVKPLEDYLQEKSGFSGATILGDGRISLILDVYELINLSQRRQVKSRFVDGVR